MTLAKAYHLSDFDSAEEADDAAIAYATALKPVFENLRRSDAALEIGTGTGIFLEILKGRGFETAVGVEPSAAAIAAAPPHRRSWIHEATFTESDFQPESFDLICCFMTLEHVRNPLEIVSAAGRLLRPGGALAVVTHDYRSPINRILGKRSPIIDIEHMQLFSQKSIRQLLETGSFESIETNSFKNCYALRYWMRLLPLPRIVKDPFIKLLDFCGLGKAKVSMNVGNILTVAYRPHR
jgi:SAM-dependent methyltransferase